MNKSILEKLDAIEKLVQEVRRELMLSSGMTPDAAPLCDTEPAIRKITLSLGNEPSYEDEIIIFDLDNMELEELWAFVNELELDLPREATRKDLIAAIMAKGW